MNVMRNGNIIPALLCKRKYQFNYPKVSFVEQIKT